MEQKEKHIINQHLNLQSVQRQLDAERMKTSVNVSDQPSTSTGGSGTIDKYLKPHVGEDVREDVIVTQVKKPKKSTKYLPKKVEGAEDLVLVQAAAQSSTSRRMDLFLKP